MAKLIKFDLSINNTKARNLEELRANFTIVILELYTSGILLRWLESRELTELAQAIEAINKADSELEQLGAICRALELDDDPVVLQFLLEDRKTAQVLNEKPIEKVELDQVEPVKTEEIAKDPTRLFELEHFFEQKQDVIHDGERVFLRDAMYSRTARERLKIATDYFERQYTGDSASWLKDWLVIVITDEFERNYKTHGRVIDISGMYITKENYIVRKRGSGRATALYKIDIDPSDSKLLFQSKCWSAEEFSYDEHPELKPKIDAIAECINSYFKQFD